MKKVFSLILALLTLVSMTTFATSTVLAAEEDFFIKPLTDTTAEITGYAGDGGNVIIPDTIGGYTVTKIGDQAFYQNKNLKNVTLPEGVTEIGFKAFAGAFITGIKMPDTVTTLGNNAFSYCINLTDVTLSKNIKVIPNNAFSFCTRLESITIPEGVEDIDISAFQSCYHLASVSFPDSLNTVGEYAFAYTAIKNLTLPEGLEEIRSQAFFMCEKMESAIIPSTVKTIGKWAFGSCFSLTDLIICDGVEKIEAYAFDSSPIAVVEIPSSVYEIGEYALGYYYVEEDFSYYKYEDFEIICEEGSAAAMYAANNDITFGKPDEDNPTKPTEPDDTKPTEPDETDPSAPTDTEPSSPEDDFKQGDVNMDGNVNIKDATAIQKHLVDLIKLHEKALELAEFDGDNKITVRDATAIQKHIAGLA